MVSVTRFDAGVFLVFVGGVAMLTAAFVGAWPFVVGVLLYGAGLATMFSIGEEHA